MFVFHECCHSTNSLLPGTVHSWYRAKINTAERVVRKSHLKLGWYRSKIIQKLQNLGATLRISNQFWWHFSIYRTFLVTNLNVKKSKIFYFLGLYN